jgi:hypothetical protein
MTKLTTSDIFTQAAIAKVKLSAYAHLSAYGDPFYCCFESSRDGMEIKGNASSSISIDAAVASAWEKFTTLALHGNKKLLAPMIEHVKTGMGDREL